VQENPEKRLIVTGKRRIANLYPDSEEFALHRGLISFRLPSSIKKGRVPRHKPASDAIRENMLAKTRGYI
jgi:hypothetical protein